MSYSSYRVFKEQYSLDNGSTWQDVEPLVGEPRYITTYETLDECALNNYKAIYYYKSGKVKYVPCDGDDRLSGNYGGGEVTLLVVGNCVKTLGPIGIIRRLQLPPNGILETIEDGAFSNSGLGGAKTTLNPYIQYIPDTVKYIGNNAFDCTDVDEYHIGSGVTYVGWRAFARGQIQNRKFYFYGKTAPEFPCGGNPPGWTFHTSGGTSTATIKVPCGSEIAYYNAICSSNIDGAVRETIFDNIDDECNWSAKIFFKGSDKDNPYKARITKTTLGVSTYSGGSPTDIEISTEKQIYGIDYYTSGDLNSIKMPDNIWYIKELKANSIEKFFMPSQISRLDNINFKDVDYFEYGMTPLTINEGALGVSGTTCRIGEYGSFGNYSGINLKFENVIIELDSAIDLRYAFKKGKIHNLYVKASAYDGYLNQYFYDNIYIIGEQTGTTWVPAKREYIYDEDTDEYYFKEYERKDFENGMYYFTQNYRKGALIPQRPYYVDLGEKEEDVEAGIIWNIGSLMLNTGDYEVPLYEKKRTTPYQQYMFESWYSGSSKSVKQVCEGTEITSDMIGRNITRVKMYNNCVTSIGSNAFASKVYLYDIKFSDNVKTIGDSAFYNCWELKSITLPPSVESIGNGVFNNCIRFSDLTLEATTPPAIGSNVFDNTPSTMKIYVPASSLEKYRNSWTEYASLIYPIS